MLKKVLLFLGMLLFIYIGLRLTDDVQALAPDTAQTPAVAQTIPDTKGMDVKAKAAVVIDGKNGRVLFARNANAQLPMASTTKIMSALLVLEQEKYDLDQPFIVDSTAIRVEGSSMGLREGDTVTLRALCYGMLLASGNDGANAAAVRVAGSQEKFAAMMNERAQELGMEDTHFVTPSGLDDKAHYSSAYDMALLAKEALNNPDFAEICGQKAARVQYGNPPYNRWLTNHNRLLRIYPGAIGVKTGFTDSAGRCLVSSAERESERLIVVTLGCSDDWREHTTLYDHFFKELIPTDPSGKIPAFEMPVTGGVSQSVPVGFAPPEPVALLSGEQMEVSIEAQRFLYAPVHKGDVVGCARFTVDGQQVGEVPLTAGMEVPSKEKKGFFARLFCR